MRSLLCSDAVVLNPAVLRLTAPLKDEKGCATIFSILPDQPIRDLVANQSNKTDQSCSKGRKLYVVRVSKMTCRGILEVLSRHSRGFVLTVKLIWG